MLLSKENKISAFIKETKELMAVILGEAKADLTIVHARLVNVYTGELLDDQAVSIKGQRIAYVGPDPDYTIGPKTKILDAQGKVLIPGLIDGHAHLAWLMNIEALLGRVMPGGTTTIITETMEPFPIMGTQGVLSFMESLENQPIKIWATAPAMVSISPATKGIDAHTLQSLLERPDILGLGETYWQGLLQEPDQYLKAMQATLSAGKYLEGHSAGASDKKLSAYIAAGISSCHEPVNAEEALERLRLGLYVMVREGSIRRDLEEVAKIKDQRLDLRRMILVTDGIQPKDLQEKGYMEYLVQKAVDYGFSPIAAIQMATLNVATHFGLDHLIGGIAPGKYADLVIIPDLSRIRPLYVISNGCLLAEQGRLLIKPRQHVYSAQSKASVRLDRIFRQADFMIPAPPQKERVLARVIHQVTGLVTRELLLELPVRNGQIYGDPAQDIIKVAAISRAQQPGRMFVGLLKGFGLKSGAFASSAAWDTADIIVAGVLELDMALAINRLHELQGGAVICDKGKIVRELPLPVWGLLSELPLDKLIRKMEEINESAVELGFAFPDPILTLITLTGAAIPYLRICESGLVNLKNGKILGLFADEDT